MSRRIALVSLHTSPGDDPGSGDVGGMNVVVRHTAVALAANGNTVDILTRRTSPDAEPVAELSPGVRLLRLDAGPAEPRVKGEHEAFIEPFAQAMEELEGYDVVHSHHWFSGVAAIGYARARGIPHVQSFHSIAADPSTPLSHGERPESPGRMEGERMLARASDALIAVSHAEEDTIVRRLGADPTHVHVILPGVDSVLFHPSGAVPERPGTIVAAARLEPLKGLDLAIVTLAGLPESCRPTLLVAGGATTGYDEYPRELTELADRLGVSDRVRFLGPQSRTDIARLFREARLLLVPSHSETYGLVALEAAASGIPVVASASGGLVEAVDDGVTGLLLDSRDPAQWTATVRGLLEDDAFARRLGAAGRAHAERRTWNGAARRTLAVYAGVGA